MVKIEKNLFKEYDCINNIEKSYQVPPIEVEVYSKLRTNYLNLIASQPKAFNKKHGLFTHFMDKTKTE